jgi:uncharacterized protein YfaS (alpha-2-macroglobulin family)
LRYVVDTPIGSTEFTQPVRLEDKVSILLTTEKPMYQPGQVIHVRALALDRCQPRGLRPTDPLTFEVEDSRGNKVFKKATRDRQVRDRVGGVSALADEVNLGTYHLRAHARGRGRTNEYGRDRFERGALCSCRSSKWPSILPARIITRSRDTVLAIT